MLRITIVAALVVGLSTACGGDPPPIATASPTATPTDGVPTAPPSSPTPPDGTSPPPPSVPVDPSPSPAAELDWTPIALPTSADYSTIGAVDVAFGEGLFLAVGAGWQEDDEGVQVIRPLFWRSADGRSWEILDDVAWGDGYVDALTVWQGQFLAAGYVGDERASAAFWTSADGRDWQRLPDRPVLEFYRDATEGRDIVLGGITSVRVEQAELVAQGWLYCACGREIRDSAVEWRTSDGQEWQRRDLAADEVQPPRVEADTGWLRIAADGSTLESSADGETWQVAWTPPATDAGGQPTAQLFGLGRRPGGLLAVGVLFEDGVGRPLALASADGLAWTPSAGTGIDDLQGALLDFAAGTRAIVAIGRVGDPPAPYVWLHEVVATP